MKSRKPKIKNKTLRGEWAETVFLTRAIELGLPISKPWGEMRSFDFVVGLTRHFVSVQVKSTIAEFGNAYVCTVRGGHKPYPPGSFDFLAAYVVDENAWYIIPEEQTWGKGSVTLHPSPKAKYEEYREAWNLLGSLSDPHGRGINIQACAEEFLPEWVE